MTVDGSKVDGCIIPFESGKKDVNVEIIMG
jgi:hypothetical protein